MLLSQMYAITFAETATKEISDLKIQTILSHLPIGPKNNTHRDKKNHFEKSQNSINRKIHSYFGSRYEKPTKDLKIIIARIIHLFISSQSTIKRNHTHTHIQTIEFRVEGGTIRCSIACEQRPSASYSSRSH